MSNPTTETEIRDEIARLETTDARLIGQLVDLDQRRLDTETERRRNARRAEQLRSDLREILDAPETERRAAAAIAALRNRLDKPPAYPGDFRSPTRARVRNDLDKLAAEARLSPAERLASAIRLASDFSDRRHLDSLHYASTERR